MSDDFLTRLYSGAVKQKSSSVKKKEKPAHKYQRFKTEKGKTLWRCLEPGCCHSFYGDEMIAGRKAICWICAAIFTIRTHDLTNLPAKPICDDCVEKKRDLKKIESEQRKIERNPALKALHRLEREQEIDRELEREFE